MFSADGIKMSTTHCLKKKKGTDIKQDIDSDEVEGCTPKKGRRRTSVWLRIAGSIIGSKVV